MYRLLVNHRTNEALELSDSEARMCGQLAAYQAVSTDPAATAFVTELREQGFLAADPPSRPHRRALQASAARLDLRWTGAGRLVRAAHDHGARHLFRPAAVAVQALVAAAGLAAVIAVCLSGQRFQLRVHPMQIPVVIALSVAAVAIHELAHALVVVHHGRTVDAAGSGSTWARPRSTSSRPTRCCWPAVSGSSRPPPGSGPNGCSRRWSPSGCGGSRCRWPSRCCTGS
jgi:hypothetical protein